jgi:hypothetical protein
MNVISPKLPSLHDLPRATKHPTRCLRNRVQASAPDARPGSRSSRFIHALAKRGADLRRRRSVATHWFWKPQAASDCAPTFMCGRSGLSHRAAIGASRHLTMSWLFDRIRRTLVGLKMPRVLEVLDQTVRQLELGEISAHLQGRGHESSCWQAARRPTAWKKSRGRVASRHD